VLTSRGSKRMLHRLLAPLLAVLCLGACQRTLVPAPTIYTTGGPNPFAEVAPEFRSSTVEILYITDRARKDRDDGSPWYGYGRSPELAYGTCQVHLGRDASWEDLVAASTSGKGHQHFPLSIGEVKELGRFPSSVRRYTRDESGNLVEIQATQEERLRLRDEFSAHLRQRLSRTDRKDVYIFVHGFKNKFEHPMYVMAQLWHYMGREGVPVVYTWPAGSGGGLFGYTHDRESGEFTIYHLKNTIEGIAQCGEVERIHIISHSRGTDVASSALRELNIKYLAKGLVPSRELKLATVILAAPDLDLEVASQRISAEQLGLIADHVTLYVSPTDRAISLSDILFKSGVRLGRMRYADIPENVRKNMELTAAHVQIVDVVAKTSGAGHSYFYNHPGALSDVIWLLRDGVAPGTNGCRPLVQVGPGYWELRDDYCKAAATAAAR